MLVTSAFRAAIRNNILQTIGRTPVVKLSKIAPPGVNLYGKCESFNPVQSVKDRLAIAVIDDAERRGILKPGATVVEATSGNTGIALACVCANRGYPFVATMAETFSIERRKVMRAFGAKVVLTPAANGGYGMVVKARELAAEHNWFLAHQFENEANPDYHAVTTGPEILLDFSDIGLDYWVTGYGTGGTFSGAGRVLKAALPNIKIILCEPALAPMVSSGAPQERNPDGSPSKGHSAFTPHIIQGWAPNFIPKVLQKGLDQGLAHEVMVVTNQEALQCAQELAQKEGIFTGISGGATMSRALKVAQSAPPGTKILAMLPDTQERYLSTLLFESIKADMNEAEVEISKSTKGFQL